MITLSDATLAQLPSHVERPGYDRAALRAGIVQFGVGNFHRTHLAIFVDAHLRRTGDTAWGIVGVGPTESAPARRKAEAFKAQNCLYTVTEFAPDGQGSARVIGAMIDYLYAPEAAAAVIARIAAPEAKIVALTITEGGYNVRESDGVFMLDTPDVARDLAGGGPPRTVFGLIAAGLDRRRAAGLGGVSVVSCDNARGNGDLARAAILGFARAQSPDLAAWIGQACDFPNSMVDRIAPQITEADRDALNAASGIADRVPAKAESFNQWVIEDRFRAGRPALEHVGVAFSDDVPAYLGAKTRMINASHMMLAYPALLLGERVIHEAMRETRLRRLLRVFLARDARPRLQGPPGLDLDAYEALIFERFANPAIGDQVLRVAGDGASKLPVYHGKTMSMLLQDGGDMRREAFMMACFWRYLRARVDPALRDDRGAAFTVFEPRLTEQDWRLLESHDPRQLLATAPFASLGLDRHGKFVEALQSYATSLAQKGASATLDRVLTDSEATALS